MARDLSFWKKKENMHILNRDIYEELSKGNYLDCVYEIPSEQILQDIKYEFAEWEQLNDFCFENNYESFQLYITKQFVRVDCYSMTEQNINKIIDILLKYECPLYDATIDVRFDSDAYN
jgi:hypothetical protein